uniref:Uncharacterized protein n=1 Tax=Scophthalmus maximus TaxID=52904 RepID=A0A8D3DET9_SCOMX
MHFDFALVISGININSIFYSYHIITALSKGSQWLVFQATLSDIETRGETAEQELRSKVRETLVLEGDMEQLQRQTKIQNSRYEAIVKRLHCQLSRRQLAELEKQQESSQDQ